MGLAELRRGHGRLLVTARAAAALVLALSVALPAAAQTGVSASVAVQPSEAAIGQEFEVEIRLSGADAASMQIVPPVFVGVLPSGDPQVLDGPEGAVVTYRLQATRRGRHPLGGFLIRTPAGSVFTTPLQITVLGRAESAAAEPVLRWRLDTTTPFVREAVTAVLELIAPAPLPLVGQPRVEPVAALDLQPLPAADGIEPLAGSDRFVIPVARYRLTARVAGRTTLPGARVAVAGTERMADSVGLVVRRVPEPVAASRAVGDFSRTVEIRRLGTDAAELTVDLTGTGSVPSVQHPQPAVRGGSVVDTAVEVDAAGSSKQWRYRLRGDGGGALSVLVPALPYLRLPEGEVAEIAAQTITLPRAIAAGLPRGELPAIDPADRGCGAAPALGRRRACRAAELHDLGVRRFAAGDVATAVLALRAALRLRGWPETREALAGIEAATGLTGLARGADTGRLRRMLWIGEEERRMAVIGRAGAALQRVPAPEGAVVDRLPAGLPVTVSRRFDDYALIEDGAVGSGWVATAALAALQRSR